LCSAAGSKFEITASYYDSKTGTKIGTVVRDVYISRTSVSNWDDGARMFAVNSTVPFDEVRIKMTKTFDPDFKSPAGYNLANFRYVLSN